MNHSVHLIHRSSVGRLRADAVHGKTNVILRLSLNVEARLTNHAHYARHVLQQVDGALHNARSFREHLGREHIGTDNIFGVQKGCRGADGNAIGYGADIQRDIDTRHFGRTEADAFTDILFETGRSHLHPIIARSKIGNIVCTISGTFDFSNEGGCGVYHRDLGSANSGTTGILNCAHKSGTTTGLR